METHLKIADMGYRRHKPAYGDSVNAPDTTCWAKIKKRGKHRDLQLRLSHLPYLTWHVRLLSTTSIRIDRSIDRKPD